MFEDIIKFGSIIVSYFSIILQIFSPEQSLQNLLWTKSAAFLDNLFAQI